ncbi:MAG: hypothetical protein NTW80_12230 [Deltaproteobacteria bacterium]|nr:hypothetical protein [Deltaproteobacteria bacterium]
MPELLPLADFLVLAGWARFPAGFDRLHFFRDALLATPPPWLLLFALASCRGGDAGSAVKPTPAKPKAKAVTAAARIERLRPMVIIVNL